MRYGKFLEDGGTIGFVAPSFGCNIEPYFSGFNHAQEVFGGAETVDAGNGGYHDDILALDEGCRGGEP